MKTKKTTTTKIIGKPLPTTCSDKQRKAAKSLTLDQIEQKMIELATDPTTDYAVQMLNEQKLNMLTKVAELKIKRLQLKELEKSNEQVKPEPITINFVNSNTQEQKERLERIDQNILESKTVREDA